MAVEEAAPAETPAAWAIHANCAANGDSLAALAEVEPATLGGAALVDAIVASEKALSLLTATQMRLLAALAQPFVAGDPTRLAVRLARKNCAISDESDEMVQLLIPDAAISLASAEVAAALRISPVTAGIRVREADTMTTVLAPTLDALEKGVLDRGKARIIAEHCDPLSPGNKTAVQELVLPLAGAATNSELRDLTGQAVITVDPDGCDERHRAAAARRELAIKALPDAMATLRAYLPADAAVKIFQLTDLLATATAGVQGDKRGIGARRVDALADIADQLLTVGSLDLSHYLGNPLPDHGTPHPRTGNADCAGTDDGSSEPEVGNCSSPAGSGNAADSATAGEHSSGSCGSPKGSGTTGPRATGTQASNGATTGRHPEGNGTVPAGSAGRTINETAADTVAAASNSVSSDTVPAPAPAPADTVPAPSNTVPSSADTVPATSDTVRSTSGAVRGTPRPAAPKPTTAARSDKPCGACGSTSRTNRTLTRQGRRPHLSVTIGLGTLAGLDNLPGKLAGFGAIPPGLARSLAKSAETITALLIDPESGSVSKAGSLTYRPRQELRDQIAALLETCQFPSCRQPVWRCDIDHREPFDHQDPEKGGHTTPENTGPYCRRHHLFKHHTEWHTRPDPNNSTLIWISPTGHRYVKGRSQTVPPDLWVTTGATMLAERLDNICATTDVREGPTVAGSVAEELLTTMLLRQRLNRPPHEYDPAVKQSDGKVSNSNSVDQDPSDAAPRNGDQDPSDAAPRNFEQNPSDAAPRNAQSWPTINDPPPF